MSTQKVLAIQLQVNGQQAQAALNAATASTRAFASGMQRLGQQAAASGASVARVLTSWQSALLALATTISGLRIGSALTRESKSLDEFNEKLRQTGLNAQQLSTLEFVADRINVPFDTLTESVARANVELAKMRNQGQGMLFGVNLRDQAGAARDVLSVLQELGPAMQRMGMDRFNQQAVLQQAFGRQFINMDRLMGAGVLARYREEMDRLGGPTMQRNIDAGVKVADALDDVAFAWKRVKQEGVVALAELTPAIEWLAQRLGQLPTSVQGFAAALGTAAGDGADAQEAQRNVMALGRTIVEGMRDSAMALAAAAGTTAGAAFETAVAGLGPTLSDVAYDALAPLLRKLPGVSDDRFPLSLSEQMNQTRTRLRQAEAAARRQEERGWPTESRAFIQQGGILRRTAVGMELAEQAQEAGKAGLLRKELQDLEAQASRQRQERLDTFFKTLGNGATVSAEAWREAATVIDASWKRIETAAKGLGERYGDTVFGPPSSLARPSGNAVFEQLMQNQQMLAMMGGLNGASFLMGGASRAGSGEADLRGVAFVRERRQLMAELQARESIAFGGDANAARTRTQMAFAQQRNELFEKYGESARTILPTLERVQAIEERRMSLDAKVAATLRDLNKAQEEYNLSVAQRAQRVTAGLLTQDEARRADDVSASVLLSSQQAAADELRRLQQEYPEFARLVDDTTRDVRISMEQLAMSLQRISRGDWRAGFRAGLEDIRLQAEDVFTFTRDLTVGVANTMASGFSTAFLNIVNGTENVKDAFRNLAGSVLTSIAQMTTQMLVFRAIAGIAGSFAGGTGGVTGASLGGAGRGATASGMSIPNASSGLSLNSLLGPAGRFASGAAFHRGEVVPFASGGVVTAATHFPMSRGRTGLMGEAGPEAIVPLARTRQGRLGIEVANGGGRSITIAPVVTVNIASPASEQGATRANSTSISGGRIGRDVAAAIVDAIQRDPDLRMIVRQM